jgi:hypothetical protein
VLLPGTEIEKLYLADGRFTWVRSISTCLMLIEKYHKEKYIPKSTNLNCAKREEAPGLPPWGKRFAMVAAVGVEEG